MLHRSAAGYDASRHLELPEDCPPERSEPHVTSKHELTPTTANATGDLRDGDPADGFSAITCFSDRPLLFRELTLLLTSSGRRYSSALSSLVYKTRVARRGERAELPAGADST